MTCAQECAFYIYICIHAEFSSIITILIEDSWITAIKSKSLWLSFFVEKYISPYDPVSGLLLCSDRSNSVLVRSISGIARQASRIFCFKIKIYPAADGGLTVRGGYPGKSLPRTSRNTQCGSRLKKIFINVYEFTI